MNQTGAKQIHEAIITGTEAQIEAAAKAAGCAPAYAASGTDGRFVTGRQGHQILNMLAQALGQQYRPAPKWDSLTRDEQTALLQTAAGDKEFARTGMIPEGRLTVLSAQYPDMINRIFPKYRRDSRLCQLGLLEGCDSAGAVELHVPGAALYACVKCWAKDQGTTQKEAKRQIRSTASGSEWIHPAELVGHVCPGDEQR